MNYSKVAFGLLLISLAFVILCNSSNTYAQVGMPAPPQIVNVKYNDSAFEVKVWMDDGSVKQITIDQDFNSLVFQLNTMNGGFMQVAMPRALIDSKHEDGTDDTFFVLADGDEVNVSEGPPTGMERTISMQIPANAEELEILGTQVVPEFPIAVLAIMGAIVSVSVVMGKFRSLYQGP